MEPLESDSFVHIMAALYGRRTSRPITNVSLLSAMFCAHYSACCWLSSACIFHQHDLPFVSAASRFLRALLLSHVMPTAFNEQADALNLMERGLEYPVSAEGGVELKRIMLQEQRALRLWLEFIALIEPLLLLCIIRTLAARE